MSGFTERMVGAATLDGAIIEEIEHDRSGTGQALGVVVLASAAAGIGMWAYGGVTLLLSGMVAAILGWALWAGLIWLIGTKLLPESQTRADWSELARTTGFAQTPGILRLFGFVPLIGGLVVLVANLWMLVSMVVAVRHALDYESTWRALLVVLIGWLANAVLFALLTGFSWNG